MRSFRDRDYVETSEGFYFTVIGNVHPQDRVIAYLKYVPSELGLWGSRSKRYDRVLKHYTMKDLEKTLDLLESRHPEYIFHSPVLDVTFSAVPHTAIKRHLLPEKRLAQLLMNRPRSLLERKVTRLARQLSATASVPIESFGVTGSVLIGIHKDFSDIDLVVYGRSQSLKVKRALSTIMKEERSEIKRMTGRPLQDFVRERASSNNLAEQEAIELYERKWNRGLAFGTPFSIHPVKLESEEDEKYGDRLYAPVGITEIEATVKDSSDSMFMPALYLVSDVKWLGGEKIGDVREVVSYEGLYSDIANQGERVKVRGRLEEVMGAGAERLYQRVVIGSREAMNTDYLKPIPNSQ
jgi:predicted nucleotidyltransferase